MSLEIRQVINNLKQQIVQLLELEQRLINGEVKLKEPCETGEEAECHTKANRFERCTRCSSYMRKQQLRRCYHNHTFCTQCEVDCIMCLICNGFVCPDVGHNESRFSKPYGVLQLGFVCAYCLHNRRDECDKLIKPTTELGCLINNPPKQ